MTASALPKSVDAMLELLSSRGYLAERSLATVTYLSLRMGRPLFLEGGDWETLLASVDRLLERFGPDAVVYPGHGEPTTLGRELATNPFLGELRAAR
jgi:hypothetical protein